MRAPCQGAGVATSVVKRFASTPEHASAIGDLAGELLDERGLADAGLAGYEHRAATARTRSGSRIEQGLQVRFAFVEGHRGR